MLIKCKYCGILRNEKDFLGKDRCFKCVYREKLLKFRREKKKKMCRVCGDPVIGKRRVYCSDECTVRGTKTTKQNHWTKFVKSVKY